MSARLSHEGRPWKSGPITIECIFIAPWQWVIMMCCSVSTSGSHSSADGSEIRTKFDPTPNIMNPLDLIKPDRYGRRLHIGVGLLVWDGPATLIGEY